MFLKNDSIYKVGLRTKKEVLEIRPQEVVFILESDLLEMNKNLKVVSEEEFNASKQETKQDKETTKEKDEVKVVETKVENTPEKCKECYADGKTPAQEDCDKCNAEVKNTETENKPEDNKPEDNKQKEDEKTSLIDKLKEKWQKTSKPAEKAKIAKQIKKLQGE